MDAHLLDKGAICGGFYAPLPRDPKAWADDAAPSLGERIALAIEAAADEHNRNIARMAGLPYDPDRHDGAVANGLRRAARIARETT
jgi:hypothetical protein